MHFEMLLSASLNTHKSSKIVLAHFHRKKNYGANLGKKKNKLDDQIEN